MLKIVRTPQKVLGFAKNITLDWQELGQFNCVKEIVQIVAQTSCIYFGKHSVAMIVFQYTTRN